MNQSRDVERKATVLVVGILDSPHVARWIRNLVDLPVSFVFFPSSPNRKVHPELRRLAENQETAKVSIRWFESRFSILIWLIDLVVRGHLRAYLLRRQIKALKPDVVHALEIQHAGYTLHRALRGRPDRNVKIGVTNYGSDIFWFQRFPGHQIRIRELLRIADFYSAECLRDVDFARAMGFLGEALSVLPNAGGMSGITSWSPSDFDQVAGRRTVLIKGYTNFVGRAQDIISELARNSERFDGWNIVVYSATLRARLSCVATRIRRPGLKLTSIRKKSLTHAEMIELFSTAAAYVGFSRSDGVSTSFLEALAHGAYPLQTSTACISEWHDRGARFSSLNVEDPEQAIRELLRVLGDTRLRVEAARVNREVALANISAEEIGQQMRADYARILKIQL